MSNLDNNLEETEASLAPFDFKKYMICIHYRLERKLVGKTCKLKNSSKFI